MLRELLVDASGVVCGCFGSCLWMPRELFVDASGGAWQVVRTRRQVVRTRRQVVRTLGKWPEAEGKGIEP